MKSRALYNRYLLFLLPSIFLIFSIRFLKFLSSSQIELLSKNSLNQSSYSSLSSIKPIFVRPKHSKCRPFNVSDTRPFFDREPPQLNLPRRISNSKRKNLHHRLRSLRLTIVVCASNAEKVVDKCRNYIESIIDLFHPSSHILIGESDSRDNTLIKLHQWSRAQIYTYGNLSKSIPKRTERIAFCRNELLEKARQLKSDYMLVLDIDIIGNNVNSFLSNFEYDTNDWSVMTANAFGQYYDIWALRTLSETILNYDVWHRIWSMRSTGSYCNDSLLKNILNIHQKPFPIERDLLEVRSAFGGAGLYKMDSTKNCYYSGAHGICEHVPFHLCMREKKSSKNIY
ncbi:unnamed protein product [Rotaria sordida]|uniref:Uncharacterized protein n=1 Tax=Rotaria sordida TaxID=392033 RepID=A0A815LC57_9BILA|nr:unnamed protein product [Rotaria sordida]